MKKKLFISISIIVIFVIFFLAKKRKQSKIFENRFGLDWIKIGNKCWSVDNFSSDDDVLGI